VLGIASTDTDSYDFSETAVLFYYWRTAVFNCSVTQTRMQARSHRLNSQYSPKIYLVEHYQCERPSFAGVQNGRYIYSSVYFNCLRFGKGDSRGNIVKYVVSNLHNECDVWLCVLYEHRVWFVTVFSSYLNFDTFEKDLTSTFIGFVFFFLAFCWRGMDVAHILLDRILVQPLRYVCGIRILDQ